MVFKVPSDQRFCSPSVAVNWLMMVVKRDSGQSCVPSVVRLFMLLLFVFVRLWLFMVICVFWSDDLGGLEWYSKGGVAVSLRKVERRIWQEAEEQERHKQDLLKKNQRICLKKIKSTQLSYTNRICLRIVKRACFKKIKRIWLKDWKLFVLEESK